MFFVRTGTKAKSTSRVTHVYASYFSQIAQGTERKKEEKRSGRMVIIRNRKRNEGSERCCYGELQ